MSRVFNKTCGKPKKKLPPLYTINGGTSTYAQSVAADGTVNWELALLSGTSATITFQRVVDTVDVFLVAGGKPGTSTSGTQAGGGGKGGGRTTANNVSVSAGTSYTFTVGSSNGSTSIFGKSAASGNGANAGTGANFDARTSATGGSAGAYAFGSSNSLLYSGRRYGPGGGGGGWYQGNFVVNGGSGGATGGGHGGDSSHTTQASTSGSANTGAGGGGAGGYVGTNAGLGGSGIIIIRNHRS